MYHVLDSYTEHGNTTLRVKVMNTNNELFTVNIDGTLNGKDILAQTFTTNDEKAIGDFIEQSVKTFATLTQDKAA